MKIISFSLFICMFFLGFSQNESNIDAIKNHLTGITKTDSYRNFSNITLLNTTADYIKKEFEKSSDSVYFQEFKVKGNTYKNVIASFGTTHKKRIIVGAHYDVAGNQEGADDNASGVVGLLELSRILKNEDLKYRIDLVAYTLEEPPFFRTNQMGSYVHASSLANSNIDVYGMVSLEMIGYFSEEAETQFYPDARLSQIYGDKGNFITLVNKTEAENFAIDFSENFKKNSTIKTVVFNSNPSEQSADFSDHLNYWDFGFSALMITDTAFLRNRNYHKSTDVMETLDLESMAKVINSVFRTLKSL